MNPRPITENTLFYGDNLDILRRYIADESIDLIYLDPPFNSNRDYNVLFKEGKVDSGAQIHAFGDTWEWTPPTIKIFEELVHGPNARVAITINSLAEIVGKNSVMAYLVNMTARLIPLRRVLKSTGTLYLHCDPTASHYLKVLMDAIFGQKNFRNEIIWAYRGGGTPKKDFGRRHDVLLRYSKTDEYLFYPDAVRIPYQAEGMSRTDDAMWGKHKGTDKVYKPNPLGKVPEDWWLINVLNANDPERLGYPTQKPEMLLRRIIKASSKEGDWILDPFCGCGTAVVVAEEQRRNWIGIDVSIQAINVIKQRLQDHYPTIQVPIDGIPRDYASARALAAENKFKFQDWAISLIEANPPAGEPKKGADRGIDGLILFYEPGGFNNPNVTLRKIVVQVKGGATGRGDVAKLKGDMERENAPMSVLITLRDPTPEMKREAALAGEYQYSATKSFPRVQILSINNWFDGARIVLPSNTVNPFKKAETKADQETFL